VLRPYLDVGRVPISSLMIIVLPEMLEAAWARALPGRESVAQNEVLRMFYCTTGKPSPNAYGNQRGIPMNVAARAIPIDLPTHRDNNALIRAATVAVRAAGIKTTIEAASRALFGNDQAPLAVLRAASSPNVLANNALVGFQLVDLAVLAPMSASAQLVNAGLQLNFAGKGMISVPSYLTSATDAGSWVAEGNPIPVRQIAFTPGANLEPRKLCVIATFTREVTEQADVERIVREALQRSASLALDAAIFSNAAGDTTKPSGILNNITPLSPTAGGNQLAMITDIANLIGELNDKGGGANPIFIASPETATAMRLWAPPAFNYPILASNAVTVDTVIAIEGPAFVSGFSPMRSLFQTDCVALKMILRASWCVRGGLVATVSNVTW
jgi:Phage capsid family